MALSLRPFSSHSTWGTGSLSVVRQPPPEPAPVLDLQALQAASSVLQEKLNKDASAVPDLGEMFTIPGRPSSAMYSVFPDDYRVPFQKRRLLGIPEEVFKFYQTTHHTTHMGFLPEIERVWISVDHQLILWDYVEGQELNTYAEQSDVISYVALVKPKSGIFVDEIHHLLVICTPVSVLLLGVQDVPVTTPSGRRRKDLRVYATGMSVSTEVEMTSVIGTAEGRIFMASAQDGNLYELHYQEKEGWFGRRIQLINHSVGGVQSLLPKFSSPASSDRITQLVSDLDRQLFYSLSESGIIGVYKSSGEKAVQLLQTISNIYKAALDKAPGNPILTPSTFKIVALEVVHPSESRIGIQLVAITSNGIRLYFSSTAVGFGYNYGSSSSSGRALQLTHLRLPPTELIHPDEQSRGVNGPPQITASASTSRPFLVSGIDNFHYSLGVTLAAQPGENDARDFILCLSPDLTRIGTFGQVNKPLIEPPLYNNGSSAPQRPPLAEYASLLHIPGRTWAMAAVKQSSATGLPATQELSVQFSEPSRQFMILTSAGITFLAKRRPLDYLRDVIEEYHAEGNVQGILHFRDSFGRDQTCAMLLALACGNTFLELGDLSALGKITSISPQFADVAKQAFYDFGERPIFTERMTYGTGDGSGTTLFSGRREGLAFYFARIVRPIWKTKITKPGPAGLQQLDVSEELLEDIQKNLQALKDFLDQNPQLFHSAPGDHAGARAAAPPEQDAWRLEQQSVSQLQRLLGRTTEAISFILLLNDYRMGEIIAQCDGEVQKTVASLTFEDLVTTPSGVSASRALVNILIDEQIGQQVGVDAVSEVLQSRCGSFCSTDDVMLYKAKENIRRAFESKDPKFRQESLGDSLRLFMKGARILDFERLREIVGDYQHLQYAKGAIELPLYCAQVEDSEHQGKNWWLEGCPAGDSRSQTWERRRRCYDLVLDSLGAFSEAAAKVPPTAPGAPADGIEAVRSAAYEFALGADDEAFHSTLYDWLIERGLADELLDMRPPYLEAHLQRPPATVPKFQLLWQFYVKAGQPLRAAESLGMLAESAEFNLTLDQRIEYLTLAVGNAKSQPAASGQRLESALAQLTDLEEKLEVAQVQLEVLNTLQPRTNEGGQVGALIEILQRRLLGVSDLYTRYAEPFDLPVIKLLILHVSGHRDDNLARSIWNQIFEEAIEGVEGEAAADRIASRVTPIGQRFHASDCAFPTKHVAALLVRFSLANKGSVPHGWATRILLDCGVPHVEVWDLFNEMYESQIPPFNAQENVQAISSDIAVFLEDWLQAALRPGTAAAREFPVGRVDAAIDQYVSELGAGRTETRERYERVRRTIRKTW